MMFKKREIITLEFPHTQKKPKTRKEIMAQNKSVAIKQVLSVGPSTSDLITY